MTAPSSACSRATLIQGGSPRASRGSRPWLPGLDRNGRAPSRRGLREGHGQKAVLEHRAHLGLVDGCRKPDTPRERAVGALDAIVFFVLVLLFRLLLALDGQ